mgnify:CR=1 FL=1
MLLEFNLKLYTNKYMKVIAIIFFLERIVTSFAKGTLINNVQSLQTKYCFQPAAVEILDK